MTNRREFLQAAAVLTSTPLLNRMAFAGSGTAVSLDAVIYDKRHRQACEFAARAGLLGAALRPIQADITDLWQDELRGRWQARPAATVGLTERPALFLLERLAWDHGLRVVFEAEHVPDGQAKVVHRIIRSGDTELALKLAAAGRDWPYTLADSMIAGTHATTRDYHPTNTAMAGYPDEPVKLYSWIIAPRKTA